MLPSSNTEIPQTLTKTLIKEGKEDSKKDLFGSTWQFN